MKYPLNLYADVFDIKSRNVLMSKTKKIPDLEKSVNYILSYFSREERIVLSVRYQQFNKISVVAKNCNLSLIATESIIDTCLKKLAKSLVFRIGIKAALQRKSGNDLPCKIGQRVFVIDTLDSENCEYIVVPCTVNCIIITADNVQLKRNETSNHLWHWKKDVFATAEKAEETKNQLVKQKAEGA